MREYDALKDYPQSLRSVGDRTIQNRIIASYRGREFFDGDRVNGYGGLVYDGRWKSVAEDMIEHYLLHPADRYGDAGSLVLQLNCEKGFLLREFKILEMRVIGIETSSYARRHAEPMIRDFIKPKWVGIEPVDLLIAIGVVYMLNLSDAIECLKRIEESSFNAFITLASYDTEEDLKLFKKWSLLACTILKKDEWIEVMQHAGYTGDYSFVNAETLKLHE